MRKFYTSIDEVTNGDLLKYVLSLDFSEQLSIHREVLIDMNNDLDLIEDMEFFNDYFCNITPFDLIELVCYGYSEPCKESPFNPNDDFFSWTGYGHLRSMSSYLAEREVREWFENWLADDGYQGDRDKVQATLLLWDDEKDLLERINECLDEEVEDEDND